MTQDEHRIFVLGDERGVDRLLETTYGQVQVLAGLQRARSAWSVRPEYPYLVLRVDRLLEEVEGCRRATLLTMDFLCQNIERGSIRTLLAVGIVGRSPGASADTFVRGASNPNATVMVSFDDPLRVGSAAFIAVGNQLIVADDQLLYQHIVGEPRPDGAHTYPSSDCLPFDGVKYLHEGHRRFFLESREQLDADGVAARSSFLDDVFEFNAAVHAEADRLHLTRKQPPLHTHDPVRTSAFGRLVHDGVTPKVEHHFALLHYTKAIQECEAASVRTRDGNVNAAALHGAYCIVALHCFVEAIANELHHLATGAWSRGGNDDVPIDRIIRSVRAIGSKRVSKSDAPLKLPAQSDESYRVLETVRKIRNRLVHATSQADDVEATTSMSTLLASVTPEACRLNLDGVRTTVQDILEQVPEYPHPFQLWSPRDDEDDENAAREQR